MFQFFQEYILGNRNQRVIPVAVSLVANHMSGIAILGIPGEVYLRGAIYVLVNLSLLIVIPVTTHLVLPVFFKVGSSSAYEVRSPLKSSLISGHTKLLCMYTILGSRVSHNITQFQNVTGETNVEGGYKDLQSS